MMNRVNFFFVTLFGIGKISNIPGSIASLVTTIFLYFAFYVLKISPENILVGVIIVFFFSIYSQYFDYKP